MSAPLKVLVCGASPDSINNNAVLRGYVANGFRALEQVSEVRTSSLESAEQIARIFEPQIIVVFGSCMPSTSHYLGLKEVALDTSACLAFWLHDDPYEFDFAFKITPLADVIFSNDRWATTHYAHPNVHHLPLAADPVAHVRPWNPHKARDVFFCGVGFPNRAALLHDCAEALAPFEVSVLGSEWPTGTPFTQNRRIANDELPDWCASSLATLNLGRRFNLANSRFNLEASTPGPRTFEAAAAGTVQCFFVESLEIERYYDEGSEILLFDTPAELRQLIEMLRDEPARAESIALAARERTLRDHTYANRCARVLDVVISSGALRNNH
ncbi:glycosyltransferase [Caballeronia sp. AZ7_KS35]|uniref:CgeB family protein n=1 Tax=Caballeronia sp. AZ7_KS35 TaxID=2921762 RepID=UPI00202910BA|nr:glycosyltransferase [Caballeronia sp. AZ7_KS35]